MLFISNAIAQEAATTAATAQPSLIANMAPLVLIFAVFYFLLIRPQQKKLKEHNEMVSSLKRGDNVLTSGGLFGKIVEVEENTNILHIEIAPDVVVRVTRTTVAEVVDKKAAETTSKDTKNNNVKKISAKKK
jgi:preprotein translocase subunit YajC